MNIAEAKDQIKYAVKAYLTRDEYGDYVIPLARQRPVLLIGAPGIGKTAIMEQVAGELGIGLVSYSMTHHTRQSALGLPFIAHKNYEGVEYDASEYTMSEIIASIYELMDTTGVREGILFLDEINCVSETLAPSMLQFLQFKTFGTHRVPDGWIIVTAGNPPEYNKSVREFDIVTLDRVKRIEVEPDFDVWKDYAYKIGVHEAIMSFLELKKDRFYQVEKTLSGKNFVTARGWVDLSDMLKLYEMSEIPVDETLVAQYLQKPDVAEEFALYYELYMRYRSEYGIEGILAGDVSEAVLERAGGAEFDERLSLLSLLLEATGVTMRAAVEREVALLKMRDKLREMKAQMLEGGDVAELLEACQTSFEGQFERGQRANSLTSEDVRAMRFCAHEIGKMREAVDLESAQGQAAFEIVQERYQALIAEMNAKVDQAHAELSNVFSFVEQAFGEGQEMLVLVTELTARYYASRFISEYGCEEYFAHNSDLLVYKRGEDLKARIEELGLDK